LGVLEVVVLLVVRRQVSELTVEVTAYSKRGREPLAQLTRAVEVVAQVSRLTTIPQAGEQVAPVLLSSKL